MKVYLCVTLYHVYITLVKIISNRESKDAVVAANAVLLNSIGPKEIWGGVPAHLIGYRDDV